MNGDENGEFSAMFTQEDIEELKKLLSMKDKNQKDENKDTDNTEEKKKRKHKKYKLSINFTALKELEGTTVSSFLDLAKYVILIDGKPYDNLYLPLSKERKNDFKRLIEHYAVIEVIGKRKYFVKIVLSKYKREEMNELELNSQIEKKQITK